MVRVDPVVPVVRAAPVVRAVVVAVVVAVTEPKVVAKETLFTLLVAAGAVVATTAEAVALAGLGLVPAGSLEIPVLLPELAVVGLISLEAVPATVAPVETEAL